MAKGGRRGSSHSHYKEKNTGVARAGERNTFIRKERKFVRMTVTWERDVVTSSPSDGDDNGEDDGGISETLFEDEELESTPFPAGGGNSALERLAGRINLAGDDSTSKHYAALSNPKHGKDRNQYTDRANRAVTEQVLDPRTRMILLKMINKNTIYEVNGCVSTGKEANVYHAAGELPEQQYALKIYKTSILTFKAREKYVTGEFRFRKGYSKSNPRKMVQVWAEKEFRNLKRLRVAGVPCPEPLFLKLHVMLMGFIGSPDGVAAPRLKDAVFGEEEAQKLYAQCIRLMRTMYQECRLVHADLSEYNLLYHQGGIVVIDVSQSVEHDHPHALDFLRHDCNNVISFFRQRHVATLDLRRLFDFITDVSLRTEDIDEYLERVHEATSQEQKRMQNEPSCMHALTVNEQVFSQAYIPRTLDEVIDIERDVNQVQTGDTQDLLYTKLTGLHIERPHLGSNKMDSLEKDTDDSANDDYGYGCSDDSGNDREARDDSSGTEDDLSSLEVSPDEDEGDGEPAVTAPLSREEIKKLRKENKAKVKAERREKRKAKVPKHVKKRREKIAHRH